MSSRPNALDALAADPATSALILDFDGVLSPIVDDPTTSAMPGEVAAIVGRLAKRLGLVAVISGRPVEFLANRIQLDGVRLIGSYGIEEFQDGVRRLHPEAERWLEPVSEAAEALAEIFPESSEIRIERKSVSVAVHWRQAGDLTAAGAAVRHATGRIAARTGLQSEPGKFVEELRPPIEIDKGSAVRTLLTAERPVTIAYAGDDLGDIPALRAVRSVSGYTLIVDHGSETDPQLLALADETFAGTTGFAAWLTQLADATGA
ncbi:MAG TPA: trehalose-phosphatase [Kineosporiaceae bacterium]|nr:trehalose-phosphatase [Kineosporiaceae bacterium]